jgi:hypothetical protein
MPGGDAFKVCRPDDREPAIARNRRCVARRCDRDALRRSTDARGDKSGTPNDRLFSKQFSRPIRPI